VSVNPQRFLHKTALRDIGKMEYMVHEMSREGLRRRSELQYSLPCHWANLKLAGAQSTPGSLLLHSQSASQERDPIRP
jgi:hypothetical protein